MSKNLLSNRSKQDQYRSLCRELASLPIFLQDWWLDAVCGGAQNWDACLSFDKQGQLLGLMPFYDISRYGISMIRKPHLTFFMGPWLIYPDRMPRPYQRYSFEHQVMGDLINQLPERQLYSITCHTGIDNWLPFYNKGFRQTTRYTYQIDLDRGEQDIWTMLKGDVRNKIRKGENLLELDLERKIEDVYAFQQKTFDRQGLSIPYPKRLLYQLDKVLAERNQRKIFFAIDQEKRHHGSLYLVWDNTTAYCLLIGVDTSLRNSGVVQYLIWQALLFSFKLNIKVFDFEGSMLPNVEPVFRHFGGKMKPYYRINKEKNKLLTCLKLLSGKF